MDEHRWLQPLSRTKALSLLGSVPIGRLVFTHQALPAIRPVNHLVEGESVIVRATAGAAITAASQRGTLVAYEADSIDPETHLGWSVIVVGTARLLSDDRSAERYRARLRPWVSGIADDVITISADVVTGYQVLAGEPPAGQQAPAGQRAPAHR